MHFPLYTGGYYMTLNSQILMEEHTLENYQFEKSDNEPRILFSLIGIHPHVFIEKCTVTKFGTII